VSTENWFRSKNPTVQAHTREDIEAHLKEFEARGGQVEKLDHAARSQPMITPLKARGVALKKKMKEAKKEIVERVKRATPLDFSPPVRRHILDDEAEE
jgi:hypothetical protein